jgi:hypothetical protein
LRKRNNNALLHHLTEDFRLNTHEEVKAITSKNNSGTRIKEKSKAIVGEKS